MKTILAAVATAACLALPSVAAAQDTEHVISVLGNGQVELKPDRGSFSVGVDARRDEGGRRAVEGERGHGEDRARAARGGSREGRADDDAGLHQPRAPAQGQGRSRRLPLPRVGRPACLRRGPGAGRPGDRRRVQAWRHGRLRAAARLLPGAPRGRRGALGGRRARRRALAGGRGRRSRGPADRRRAVDRARPRPGPVCAVRVRVGRSVRRPLGRVARPRSSAPSARSPRRPA